MANALYDKFKEECLGATNNLLTLNLKIVLVDLGDYTFSAAHEDLADIAAAGRVATSGNLANKTITGGVFDADDVTWQAVSGDQSEAIVIYIDTGTPSTSRLIAFFDTGVTGLPVTPNGGDITVAWDSGANKILSL